MNWSRRAVPALTSLAVGSSLAIAPLVGTPSAFASSSSSASGTPDKGKPPGPPPCKKPPYGPHGCKCGHESGTASFANGQMKMKMHGCPGQKHSVHDGPAGDANTQSLGGITTDSNGDYAGSFNVGNLAPGNYEVVVADDSGDGTTMPFTVPSSGARSATFKDASAVSRASGGTGLSGDAGLLLIGAPAAIGLSGMAVMRRNRRRGSKWS
jgi:hypothetical protein